jgi:predicted DNA-binding transcriptional regulator YafY
VLDDTFKRPSDFDLEAYWTQSTELLENKLHQNRATVRLSPIGFKMLEPLTSSFVSALSEIGEADADGYRTVVMPVGSLWQASSQLLRFGVDAEVLGPPELREKMREVVKILNDRYDSPAGH